MSKHNVNYFEALSNYDMTMYEENTLHAVLFWETP